MNRFSIAVDIPATPDRVWEVLADTRDLNQRYLGLEAAGLRERSVAPGWHRA